MPRPIKKRIHKAVHIEEDLGSLMDRLQDFGERWQRQIIMAAAAAVVAAVVAVGAFLYLGHVRKEAARLGYEGYARYFGIVNTIAPVSEQQRLEEALASFQAAVERKETPHGLLLMAGVQADLGRHEEAVATVDRLLEAFPRDGRFVPLARFKKAMIYLKEERTEEALRVLERLADSSADLYRDMALMEAGRILERLGRNEEAGARFARLVEEFPGSAYYQDAMLKAGLANIPAVGEKEGQKGSATEPGG
jgi:tetratricopeptide (TPR) repeat protein